MDPIYDGPSKTGESMPDNPVEAVPAAMAGKQIGSGAWIEGAPDGARAGNAADSGKVTVRLSRPTYLGGKMRTELVLDFDQVTGDDILNIAQEALAKNEMVMANPAVSPAYCLYLAARASGINVIELKALKVKDAQQIITQTQNFLMVSE